MNCNQPGSSVHGISQIRILGWAAFLSPGDFLDPGIASPTSPTLAGRFFSTEAPGKPIIYKYLYIILFIFDSVQCSHSVVSDSLQPHGLQHARPPCPSPTPGAYSNSCPLSRWCHPTISSSVFPFSSHLQSFPASGSFQMSQFFPSDGQSIGVSASTSVLPLNTQDWSPLGWTGWIPLQSKGFSRVLTSLK